MLRRPRLPAGGQCRADPPRRDARRSLPPTNRAAAASAKTSNCPATNATPSAKSPARSARALPCQGDDGAPRDLLDLAPPLTVEPPTVASGVAGANAEALLDLLPIGAMVLRGGEPLYLNRRCWISPAIATSPSFAPPTD